MAITITKFPALVNFTNNPIQIELQSDNYVQTAGSSYSAKLYLQGDTCTSNSLSGAIAENEQFEFGWEGKYFIIKAKNAPNISGFEFPSGDGSLAHANNIKVYLEYNKIIKADFNISVVNDGVDIYILFTQKRAELFPGISFSQESTIFVTSDEVAKVLRPNFKIWNEFFVKLKTDDNFNKIITKDDFIDNEGKLKLDAKEVLQSLLEYDRPTGKENNVVVCTKSIAKFYFLLAEYYGVNPELQQPIWSSDYYILRGGLSRRQYPGNAYFSEYLSNNFMTWKTDNVFVKKDQPYFLTYLLRTAGVSQLKIKIETTYAGAGVAIKYTPLVDVEIYDKLLIPCGYKQLNIGSEFPSDKVLSYKISLVRSSNVAITSVRTFKVDASTKPNSRYFLYESSLGGTECFHSYGKTELSVDFDFQSIEVKLPNNYLASDGEIEETEISFSRSYEVNTGFVINKDDFELLIDFFRSKEKYYFDAVKRELIPIKINSKSIKLWKDGEEGLYKTKFEYTYRYSDSSYSIESINLNPENGPIGDIDDGGDEV